MEEFPFEHSRSEFPGNIIYYFINNIASGNTDNYEPKRVIEGYEVKVANIFACQLSMGSDQREYARDSFVSEV